MAQLCLKGKKFDKYQYGNPFTHEQAKNHLRRVADALNILQVNEVGDFLIVSLFAQDFIELVRNSGQLLDAYCRGCGGEKIIKRGFDRKRRQMYMCKQCNKQWSNK